MLHQVVTFRRAGTDVSHNAPTFDLIVCHRIDLPDTADPRELPVLGISEEREMFSGIQKAKGDRSSRASLVLQLTQDIRFACKIRNIDHGMRGQPLHSDRLLGPARRPILADLHCK